MAVRAPRGRAGRVWLADRAAVAARACELLQRKQDLLRREHRRLAELAARTGAEWERAAAQAQLWSCRAVVADGTREVRRAAAGVGPARVDIRWVNGAGIRYPGTTTVRLPPPPDCPDPATVRAARACAQALDAAVRHAAAARAAALLEQELAATVRRLRAVRDRWIPELERALRALDLGLDELEREESVRPRWVARREREEEAGR